MADGDKTGQRPPSAPQPGSSERQKLQTLLAELPSSGDDQDDDDTGQRAAGRPGAPSFGEDYLKQYGWKKGAPIRPGGTVSEYAPKSVGGFASSTATKQSVAEMRVGTIVVPVGLHGERPAAITRVDGVRAELEFADGQRAVVALSMLRHAGAVEAGALKRPRPDAPSGGEATADVSWIVERLVVRVVHGDTTTAEDFQPYKATVAKVERRGSGSGGIVLLSNGLRVSGHSLDTVIPKKGERGMVVLGVHKGRMATVLEKSGDAVHVDIATVGPQWVQPEEICALET
jgi:hypothetical protein